MHLSQTDILASGVVVLAVWMSGVTRVQSQLWGLALQTCLLACVCFVLGGGAETRHFLVLAGLVLTVKAVGIPAFLSWSARRLEIRCDAGATLSPTQTLFVACGVAGATYFVAPQLAVPGVGSSGPASVALALLLIGMLLMITRRLALSQVVGFLVLENGIFLYGLTQTHGMPLLLEMAIAFEVLVAVMIAGLVINRLNRSFEHIDVTQLRGLRY